jgi:hypothetical protein
MIGCLRAVAAAKDRTHVIVGVRHAALSSDQQRDLAAAKSLLHSAVAVNLPVRVERRPFSECVVHTWH